MGKIWVIVWKDLVIDLRRKENILSMFFFALLTLMVFTFAAGSLQESRFRLAASTVERLGSQGLSPAQQAVLGPLSERTYPTQAGFLQALDAEAERSGTAMLGQVRLAVLEAAKGTYAQDVAPGLFWITFLLAGVLGLDKSFNQEKENGCMDGLLLTPAGRGQLYLGKMASNAFFLLLIMAMLLPLFALFFGLNLLPVLGPLLLVMLAGVAGLTALGTLLGGVVSSLRGKEMLFPLLLFPLLVPIIIGVVQLTQVVMAGEPLANHLKWLTLVAGFDAIFLIISHLVFEHVMEA